jgi:amino-acid N-acetyltransferase
MDLDKILTVTFSGVRPGEEAVVKALITDCELPDDDLTTAKLRHFVLARKGDAVIGAVGLEPFGPYALLRSLAVAETYRGQGIANRLIEAIERHARQVGVDVLCLLTMTAAGFFDHHGYRRISRASAPAPLQDTAEFTSLCPETAVCMQKKIA